MQIVSFQCYFIVLPFSTWWLEEPIYFVMHIAHTQVKCLSKESLVTYKLWTPIFAHVVCWNSSMIFHLIILNLVISLFIQKYFDVKNNFSSLSAFYWPMFSSYRINSSKRFISLSMEFHFLSSCRLAFIDCKFFIGGFREWFSYFPIKFFLKGNILIYWSW